MESQKKCIREFRNHKCLDDPQQSGKGLGKGGKATIYIDSKAVADGRVEKTQPNIFSADETADVGLDDQTPVAEGIGYGFEEIRFTGKINKVNVAVK